MLANQPSQPGSCSRKAPSKCPHTSRLCVFVLFADQLKVDDIKTGHRFKCSRPNCVCTHKKVHSLSRQEILTIVDTFPPSMKAKCTPLIKGRKEGRVTQSAQATPRGKNTVRENGMRFRYRTVRLYM